ncbi:hypothetical protein BJX62DRAFT_183837 [Aspergillus germanicus]
MSTVSSRSVSKGSDFEQVYASPIVLQSRGADEESVTRRSKKRRQRVFSDEEGKLAEDGRKRPSRGSSDDDGTNGWDGFINEDLRVGAPSALSSPFACSLPASLLARKPSAGSGLRNNQRPWHSLPTAERMPAFIQVSSARWFDCHNIDYCETGAEGRAVAPGRQGGAILSKQRRPNTSCGRNS